MKLKKKPLISCRKCNGRGRLEISQPLADVYFLVEAHRGIEATKIDEILKLSGNGFSATAVNMRLNDLMALNLVERTRIGNAFQYFAVKGK